MKNKKLTSLNEIILMIVFSLFSVYRSLNSGNNWKIIASFSALFIFASMYFLLFKELKRQKIN